MAKRVGKPGTGTRRLRAAFTSRPVLLIAFAFAVMGDPVSSVAYAIEAGLRSLGGRLTLLIPTMIVVLGIIVLVAVNYHYLYARFPEGGGDAAASASAFSEGLAFLPLAALIVDYALTIAISVAAGASAIIAYLPELAPTRVGLALVLLLAVAGLTLLGHGGRAVFAMMTVSFAVVGSAVIILGARATPVHHLVVSAAPAPAHVAVLGVLLAFPVGMALATGVEAPSSAIAQLAQLDNAGRLRFGRTTLWLMVGIVVWLTLGIAVLGVRLRIGLPPRNSTWIAEVAQAAAGRGALFAAFQVSSAVLLLAAASSSFQAGPGLLKALARGGGGAGILPAFLSKSNRHHTPYWGVAVFLAASAVLVAAAGAQEQRLVLFYAVAVFIAFWCGLAAMTRFFRRDGRPWLVAVSVSGVLAVGLTLGFDFARGYPIVSFIAACAIAAVLYWIWVRAGRPRGVARAEQIAEADSAGTHGSLCDPGHIGAIGAAVTVAVVVAVAAAGNRVAGGIAETVVDHVKDQLTGLLDLQACRFEAGSPDGTVVASHVHRDADVVGMPEGEVELRVASQGRYTAGSCSRPGPAPGLRCRRAGGCHARRPGRPRVRRQRDRAPVTDTRELRRRSA